jgi:hypothetical protein
MNNLEKNIFNFICQTYVQQSDKRQQSMGLQYTTVETHDFAVQLANFIAHNIIERAAKIADSGFLLETGNDAANDTEVAICEDVAKKIRRIAQAG